MSYESQLCKKFVLSAEWDRAVAAVSKKDYALTCEDYANRAYARCFQATNAHKNGNYDDAIEDASQTCGQWETFPSFAMANSADTLLFTKLILYYKA